MIVSTLSSRRRSKPKYDPGPLPEGEIFVLRNQYYATPLHPPFIILLGETQSSKIFYPPLNWCYMAGGTSKTPSIGNKVFDEKYRPRIPGEYLPDHYKFCIDCGYFSRYTRTWGIETVELCAMCKFISENKIGTFSSVEEIGPYSEAFKKTKRKANMRRM